MLTQKEYDNARVMLDAYNKAALTYCQENRTNGIPCDICATFPYAGRVDNALRSAIEVYEFCNDPPGSYFLYVDILGRQVTTWTGEKLGDVVGIGIPFRSNMGDTRRYIWIKAINGRDYYGTFYESAGDYARIKALKYPL